MTLSPPPAVSDQFTLTRPAVTGHNGIVACQHYMAAEAGTAVLEAGGNAIDAAVTTALAMGVVEPWMSGIGGGGFMLYGEAATGKVHVIDFGMIAPRALDPSRYELENGGSGNDALFTWPKVADDRNQVGSESIAVPGAVAGFSAALERFGTIAWVDAFPDAEVHAIDVSAGMIRMAHAKLERLGKKVHFSQQNAEATEFPDNHFDLIVSNIMLHETSTKALPRIMKDGHRILKPGGVMVHAETPMFKGMDPYDQFILDWDTYNNNEPFWGPLKDLDLAAFAAKQGFDQAKCFSKVQPSAIGEEYAKGRTSLFQAGDFGGAGAWFLFGAER